MVRFHPDARFRVSKRGLVLAGAAGDTALLEHPRAADLPLLLEDDPTPDMLVDRLGQPVSPELVEDLLAIGVLSDGAVFERATPPRFDLSRDGLMIGGIERPARWLARRLTPVLLSLPGRVAVAAVVIAGVVALLSGRPQVPAVSATPALEALLSIALTLGLTVLHEFGHAVALVHFGAKPSRAGFGFYWGAISFFVDSTPAMTLSRRARVTQALAGLAVDVVTVAVLAILAHLVTEPLLAIVFWRVALMSAIDILVNLAPILEVDGHWALADLLDEPDLAPRARRALSRLLQGRASRGERMLAAYGAVSLTAGIGLLVASLAVYWATSADLILALFRGSPVDVAVGLYYVVPIALAGLFSLAGLVLELVRRQQ